MSTPRRSPPTSFRLKPAIHELLLEAASRDDRALSANQYARALTEHALTAEVGAIEALTRAVTQLREELTQLRADQAACFEVVVKNLGWSQSRVDGALRWWQDRQHAQADLGAA